MARVGLVFGGRSVEHRVSVVSARTVKQALEAAGHHVVPLGIAEDGSWVNPLLAKAALAGEREALPPVGMPARATLGVLIGAELDVIFPLVHGTWGEDGTLQGLLEMLDLPYVGAGVAASAIAMDKLATKRILAATGVPVVEHRAFRRREIELDLATCVAATEALPLPLFVKPSVGGSSVGVAKVSDRTQLGAALLAALAFDDTVLVERGVAGRELECAVLGGSRLKASVVGEIVPGREFYDYADKYLTDGAQLLAPAVLDEAVATRLRQLAIEAFAAIGGWGMARVDFLLDRDGSLYVNELNTLPGFTAISMYPRLWGLSGLALPQLVDRLVSLALDRHLNRQALDLGIREFLRELAVKG